MFSTCPAASTCRPWEKCQVQKKNQVLTFSDGPVQATANQKMLILQGHLADIPADQQDAMDEIQQALKEQRVKDLLMFTQEGGSSSTNAECVN